MKIYTVCDGAGSSCSFKTTDEAFDFIVAEIEGDLLTATKGDRTKSLYIEIEEMTEEEFAALPEFDGF